MFTVLYVVRNLNLSRPQTPNISLETSHDRLFILKICSTNFNQTYARLHSSDDFAKSGSNFVVVETSGNKPKQPETSRDEEAWPWPASDCFPQGVFMWLISVLLKLTLFYLKMKMAYFRKKFLVCFMFRKLLRL